MKKNRNYWCQKQRLLCKAKQWKILEWF